MIERVLDRWRQRSWELMLCFGTDDPIHGESAFVEVRYRDQPWAYVTLEGVDRNGRGDARTAGALVYVMLVAENDDRGDWDKPVKRDFGAAVDRVVAISSSRSFADQARRALDEAMALVVENEQGRLPPDPEGLTAFGAGFSKLSRSDPIWQELASDADQPA